MSSTWDGLSSAGVVEIPVYLVHFSSDPEDYDFVFDMDGYMESGKGMLARPAFVVYSGSENISREAFAPRFREAFIKEWEERKSHGAKQNQGSRGLTGLDIFEAAMLVIFTGGAALVPLMFLYVAARAADEAEALKNKIVRLFSFGGKSGPTKDDVDSSLARMRIRLHPDLIVNYLGPNSPDIDAAELAVMPEVSPLPREAQEILRWSISDL